MCKGCKVIKNHDNKWKQRPDPRYVSIRLGKQSPRKRFRAQLSSPALTALGGSVGTGVIGKDMRTLAKCEMLRSARHCAMSICVVTGGIPVTTPER